MFSFYTDFAFIFVIFLFDCRAILIIFDIYTAIPFSALLNDLFNYL